jgi:hypothetical protein
MPQVADQHGRSVARDRRCTAKQKNFCGPGYAGRIGSLLVIGVFWAILFGPYAWADQPRVEALVDRNRVRLSESVRLQVIITGAEGQVDVSQLSDFEIVSRGTRTSIQIVNATAKKSLIYTFTLVPRRAGRLQIPSLPVHIEGAEYMTRAIAVQVSEQPDAASGGGDVIIKARVTEETPYQGQQFLYLLTVYHAESLRNVRLEKPSFEGFTVNTSEEQKTGSTVINGRPYRSIQLAYVLIPIDAGPVVIEPSILRCDIVRPPRGSPRSMFDSFFDNDPVFGRGRLEPRVLRTAELSVKVRPLPPYTGNSQFSGLVGQFAIDAGLDLTELKTGESTTYSVTISGKGNIVDAVMPEVNLPEGFKRYQDDPEESIQLGAEGFSGQKVFRIALVPMQAGDYTIDPIQWSYFDVAKGRYRQLATRALRLKVLPTDESDKLVVFQTPASTAPSLKKRVEFTGRDILPLKEELDVLENKPELSPAGFAGLLLVPVLLYAAVMGALRLTRSRQDPAGLMLARSRQALKAAETRFTEPEQFLTLLHKALAAAILVRARTTGESLTYAEAERILSGDDSAAVQALSQKAVSMLKSIDAARYGGSQPKAGVMERLFEETRQLIKQLTR